MFQVLCQRTEWETPNACRIAARFSHPNAAGLATLGGLSLLPISGRDIEACRSLGVLAAALVLSTGDCLYRLSRTPVSKLHIVHGVQPWYASRRVRGRVETRNPESSEE